MTCKCFYKYSTVKPPCPCIFTFGCFHFILPPKYDLYNKSYCICNKMSISTALTHSYLLLFSFFSIIILSLTVRKRKNRCIPCIYWAAAIFVVVTEYSNLFPSLALLLNCFHFTFGNELIIGSKATGFMKSICDRFTFI